MNATDPTPVPRSASDLPDPGLFRDHYFCDPEGTGNYWSTKVWRAWARVIALNVDVAPLEELRHARYHFAVLDCDSIDARCRTEIEDELLRRRDLLAGGVK